jgi:superfamily II DNA or RNA helicase
MTGFTEHEFQDSYSTSKNNLVAEFYEPALSKAVRYDRSSGYFSSALMSLIPLGFADFVSRGGKIRLICSPQLTQTDYESIVNYGEPVDDLETLLANLRDLAKNSDPDKAMLARVFSSLLASGVLEMKIAKTDLAGIFHDKVGIFEDESGQYITFIGSANETAAAWSGFVNHENLEVFNSTDPGDKRRVSKHISYFEDLWANRDSTVETIDVRVVEKEIFTISPPEQVKDILAKIKHTARRGVGDDAREAPEIKLRDYQSEVLENWEKAGKKGVITFATGGGKTITCIEAISRWTKDGKSALVLVPSEYLLRQWTDEFSKWLPDTGLLVVGGRGNGSAQWGPYLETFTKNSGAGIPRIVLSTYASARSDAFRSKVKPGDHLMIAADEVHTFGSTENRTIGEWLLGGATLGMSATPERKWDEEGTRSIFAYFGEKLEPAFTLDDALEAKVLSEYDYFFERCHFTPEEDEKWDEVTQRFVMAWLSAGKKMTKKVTDILIERSRISKAAFNKTAKTVEILERNFGPDDRWLVYCESISHLNEVSEAIREKAIPGLQILEYHSRNAQEHTDAIKFLSEVGGVMLAVKCLDEGVDLPRVNKAIIMASSTNPREYIQRRGRVLRRHPEKSSAQIYDLLTFRYGTDTPTTCGEIERALLFSKSARNVASSLELENYQSQCQNRESIPDEFSEEDVDA